MIANKKIAITADTVVDDVKIANFVASLDVDNNDMNLSARYIVKEACKTHKEIIRKDRAEFEDFAYSIQDMVTKEA